MLSRIGITGASGSGVTTLGAALAARLGAVHIDTDDHFWVSTDPPYRLKRDIPERLLRLRAEQARTGRWVISGTLDGWAGPRTGGGGADPVPRGSDPDPPRSPAPARAGALRRCASYGRSDVRDASGVHRLGLPLRRRHLAGPKPAATREVAGGPFDAGASAGRNPSHRRLGRRRARGTGLEPHRSPAPPVRTSGLT